MTHSLHREGPLDLLNREYILFIYPARGFNYEGTVYHIGGGQHTPFGHIVKIEARNIIANIGIKRSIMNHWRRIGAKMGLNNRVICPAYANRYNRSKNYG